MTTRRWTGKGHNGLWSTPQNWGQNAAPTPDQSALFNDGGSWVISLAGVEPTLTGMAIDGDHVTLVGNRINIAAPSGTGFTPNDLVIQDGGTLTVKSILDLQDAVQIGNLASSTPTAGALVIVNGAVWSPYLNIEDGTLQVGSGGAWSPAGNESLIAVGGPKASLIVTNQGSVVPGTATQSSLYIGDNNGGGTAIVSGLGSSLQQTSIYLGANYSGSLTVSNEATVLCNNIEAGNVGDGTLTVTGGAVLTALTAITIGEQVPVSSTIEIANSGSVYVGTYGLDLNEGKLFMDPTATLFGSILSAGGYLIAEPANPHTTGTVRLGSAINLSDLFSDLQFGNTTWASSVGGTVLKLAGLITSVYQDSILRIASGTVEVSHAGNTYVGTELYGGTLEVAALNAAGTGALSFIGGVTRADLRIDGPVFRNTINGFRISDSIDLRGFAFLSGVTDQFATGKLTVDNGARSIDLNLAGNFAANQFTFVNDGHGGTLIGLKA